MQPIVLPIGPVKQLTLRITAPPSTVTFASSSGTFQPPITGQRSSSAAPIGVIAPRRSYSRTTVRSPVSFWPPLTLIVVVVSPLVAVTLAGPPSGLLARRLSSL